MNSERETRNQEPGTRNFEKRDWIIPPSAPVLVTGSTGFIGRRVVRSLLKLGCRNVRCFVRPSSGRAALEEAARDFPTARIEIVEGNLLYREDCRAAARDVAVAIHLAASSDKSFAAAVMNCAVTTRNLLDAIVDEAPKFKRFVNVSSFAVYSNERLRRGEVLDETCPLEERPFERNEAYCYGKMRQDRLVLEYGERHGLPWVILRPGAVYGPGRPDLSGRIGINTFGFFMHLGGGNTIPLSYVDNCADAIALAAVTNGVDGLTFNVVDDDLPTSREFLRRYKAGVPGFRSVFVPYSFFYLFSLGWEKYSQWSEGQLPPVFNRRRCVTYWRGNKYTNAKLKDLLGWRPAIGFREASEIFFGALRSAR
jgi:nucleoside-diphosphate-sugar epimerase